MDAKTENTPEYSIATAKALYKRNGRRSEVKIREHLQQAEEACEGEASDLLQVARAWLELQGYYDGENKARNILARIEPEDDWGIEPLIEHARICVETLGEGGKELARKMIKRAEKCTAYAKDWEVCADAWKDIFKEEELAQVKKCMDNALLERGGQTQAM